MAIGLQERCRRLLEADQIPERFDYVTQVVPGRAVDTVRAWLGQHVGERPLVILDTLGKVMPPALPGETTYGRDYRVAAALHGLYDTHPGMALVVNHHDRKAAASDFVATVSGTNSLAGAADTVITVTRDRHEKVGVLKVAGRDVAEGEYAVTFNGAGWQLDGGDLQAAGEKAREARMTSGLGDRSADVVELVIGRHEGVRAADIAASLDIDDHTARTYLARMAESGRVARLARGLYGPPIASDQSVASKEPAFISTIAADADHNTHNGRNTPTRGQDVLEDDLHAQEARVIDWNRHLRDRGDQ